MRVGTSPLTTSALESVCRPSVKRSVDELSDIGDSNRCQFRYHSAGRWKLVRRLHSPAYPGVDLSRRGFPRPTRNTGDDFHQVITGVPRPENLHGSLRQCVFNSAVEFVLSDYGAVSEVVFSDRDDLEESDGVNETLVGLNIKQYRLLSSVNSVARITEWFNIWYHITFHPHDDVSPA